MPETIFITLLQISAVAAAVILLLKLSASFLIKFFSAKWRYWIWLFIAARLLIPFHISFVSPPLKVEIPNPQIPISTPAETLKKETESSASAPIYNEETPFLTTPSPNEKQAETMSVSLIQVCLLVWAVGVIIFAVGQGTRYILFRKHILRWGNAPSGQTADLLASSAAGLGLGKIPDILVNAEAASPMIIGFVHPVLLLPHEHYPREDLRFIFRHELTHFRRHDIWHKLFLIIVNAVHWFNPLVYLMVREASADLELACDDEVMKNVSLEERRAYSETILAAVTCKKG